MEALSENDLPESQESEEWSLLLSRRWCREGDAAGGVLLPDGKSTGGGGKSSSCRADGFSFGDCGGPCVYV